MKNRVQVWYWDSLFFGHGTCTDVLKNFDRGIFCLNMSKLIEILVDGPSVNWKLIKAAVANREEAELPQLIDTGTHMFSYKLYSS